MSSLAHIIRGDEIGLSADSWDDYFLNYDPMLELRLEPQEEHTWDFSLNQPFLSEASSLSGSQSSVNSVVNEAITTPLLTSNTPAIEAPTPPPKIAKKKRENRYKNEPPATVSRRRAQNRASQRAYRERKEQRIQDLEQLLDEAHRKETTLRQALIALLSEYGKLNTERYTVDPCGQIDTSVVFPTTPSGCDISFAHSILPGAVAEDIPAPHRMSLSTLPGEVALELLSEDIIIS